MKRLLTAFAFFAAAAVLCSCSQKRQDTPVQFDNSQPLALIPGIEWAVITEPYAALRVTASYDADVSGHCRRGDIFQIRGQALVTVHNNTAPENWYQLDAGWIPSSMMQLYDNRLRAQKGSDSLTQKK